MSQLLHPLIVFDSKQKLLSAVFWSLPPVHTLPRQNKGLSLHSRSSFQEKTLNSSLWKFEPILVMKVWYWMCFCVGTIILLLCGLVFCRIIGSYLHTAADKQQHTYLNGWSAVFTSNSFIQRPKLIHWGPTCHHSHLWDIMKGKLLKRCSVTVICYGRRAKENFTLIWLQLIKLILQWWPGELLSIANWKVKQLVPLNDCLYATYHMTQKWPSMLWHFHNNDYYHLIRYKM